MFNLVDCDKSQLIILDLLWLDIFKQRVIVFRFRVVLGGRWKVRPLGFDGMFVHVAKKLYITILGDKSSTETAI